jgi:hypothetical protein
MANKQDSGEATFRVSDFSEIPLRGFLMRLHVLDGSPKLKDLKGGRLRVAGPDGTERTVGIRDFSVMAGRGRQDRVDRYGEVDVIISAADAVENGPPIRIGWTARGPVRD